MPAWAARARRGDAGDRFVRNAIRAQKLELLAAASEHERIAAFQAHHPPAGARVLLQQRIDALLRGLVILADALADVDALGVAARKFKDIRAHQPIEQDHVGLVQCAQRLQGQQIRIAGAGADQRNRTARCVEVGRLQGALERALRGMCIALAQQPRQFAGQQALEKSPALSCVRKAPANPRALARKQFAQARERFIQQHLQSLAQVPRQHRRGAATGDRDLQSSAPHARGHVKAGNLRIVDHVAPYAPRFRGISDRAIDGRVVAGRYRQPRALRPTRIEFAVAVGHAAGLDQAAQLRVERQRAHGHLGAGFQERQRLAPRDCAAADHEHGAATQIGEQREQRRGGPQGRLLARNIWHDADHDGPGTRGEINIAPRLMPPGYQCHMDV